MDPSWGRSLRSRIHALISSHSIKKSGYSKLSKSQFKSTKGGGGGWCSYPGVLVHTNVDLLLRGRLNEHLIPLTSRVTAKHSYTFNEV